MDRLEATIESHTMAAAQVRETCGIPGTSVRTAWLCRDKPSMKEVLRAAGVPTAPRPRPSTADEVRDFARQVGYPLILKPRTGAGALDTTRVDDDAGLDAALGLFGAQQVDSIAVEEFVEGHEGFYDTLSVDGTAGAGLRVPLLPERARGDAGTLDLAAVPGHQPDRLGGRLPGAPRAGAAGQRGARDRHQRHAHGVVLRPEGAEVQRDRLPPARGGRVGPLLGRQRPRLYRQWADSIVHGEIWGQPSRQYSAGIVALRPEQDGTISGYSGVDEIQARHGKWVLDAHLPPAGTPTQPVSAGYMANAYVRMRHPDFDTLHDMLDDVGRTVHVHAN